MPEKYKQMLKDLDNVNVKKNILTESEFEYFKPLFNSTEVENMSVEEHSELSNDYMEKISLYHPLIIVSDEVNEDNTRNVVLTLPAKFDRLKSFNETKNTKLTDILMNANERLSNPNDILIDKISIEILNKLESAVTDSDQEQYNKLMDSLYGVKEEDIPESNGGFKNASWEEF